MEGGVTSVMEMELVKQTHRIHPISILLACAPLLKSTNSVYSLCTNPDGQIELSTKLLSKQLFSGFLLPVGSKEGRIGAMLS